MRPQRQQPSLLHRARNSIQNQPVGSSFQYSSVMSILSTGRGPLLVRAFFCSSGSGMQRSVQEDVPASEWVAHSCNFVQGQGSCRICQRHAASDTLLLFTPRPRGCKCPILESHCRGNCSCTCVGASNASYDLLAVFLATPSCS